MSSILANPVFAIVLFIGLLIFVHELGHFLVGKFLGLGVETFSIGFGPELLGFTYGGTRYRVAIIPLGGYVKFAGALAREEVAPHFVGKEMYRARPWVRAATLVAGPFANFLLAVAVYAALGMQGVPHNPAIIGQVMKDSPAARAGLEPEDEILAVDGRAISSWEELREELAAHPGTPLTLQVARDEAVFPLTLSPDAFQGKDDIGRKATQGRAGISLGMLPAIVTLNAASAAASRAGIKTGEKITSLRLTAKQPDSSKSREIANWHQLQKALYWAFSLGATSLTLSVEAASLPGEKSSEKLPSREVILATSSWQALNAGVGAPVPPFSSELGDTLAEKLGLSPSPLTIAKAGEQLKGQLQTGDRIIAMKGEPVSTIFDLSEKLSANSETQVEFTIQRNFQTLTVPVALEAVDRQEMHGKTTYYALDVQLWGQPLLPAPVYEKYQNFMAALGYGIKTTVAQSYNLLKVLGSLLIGQVPLQALGGPILIAKVAQEAIEVGWSAFFTMLAVISINLGLMNLFPIPVADGGQLVLVALEAIKGKPLSEKAFENFQRIGFVMLMALIILATYNDLSRFWAGMLRGVAGFFQ
jgi:regulator of sigma E protease